MEDGEKIFKDVNNLAFDLRSSNFKIRKMCITYIENALKEKSTIKFDSYKRDGDLPILGNTKVNGLQLINGDFCLLYPREEEDVQLVIDDLSTFYLVEIFKEVHEALKHESMSYLLNHNKEYLKDIKENDPEFVQDIIDAYMYYNNRLINNTARMVLNTFIIDDMTYREKIDLSTAKELPSGIMLPFNANKNATTNHKFSWETMTFYITILEDRAYLSPFVKIVDYDRKDTNDVILKVENGELIAQ